MDKKWTPKRICAILIIIFLVLLYVITLVVAIVSPKDGGRLFAMCLLATIVVPIVAYIYIWIYGNITGKKTIASVPKVSSPEDEQKTDPSEEINYQGSPENDNNDQAIPKE